MSETLDQSAAPQRPTFLKVLCILTFVGSGLGIIMNIWGYFSYKSISSGPFGKMAVEMYKNLGLDIDKLAMGSLISAVACVLTLVGALQMWGLKKMGFYLYVLGCLASLVVAFMFMGGFALGGLAAVNIIVTAAFIVMYGLNLKALK